MNKAAHIMFLFLILCASTSAQTANQKRSRPLINSPLCTRANAIDSLQQQIASSKTFDNAIQRIAVLLRGADLLWPYERDRSLATFMEAYELAKQDFKEHGEHEKQDSKFLRSAVPDQRYKVIAALAKRSQDEARKLSEQLLDDDARSAETASSSNSGNRLNTAEKLLTLAGGLITTDMSASTYFARTSLRYPATMWLAMYLYQLAKTNKLAADGFYEEALGVYSNSPMSEYLYLSAYPFANPRDAGQMPSYTIYRPPDGFSPNPRLQRIFVQQLLARAQAALGIPVEESSTDRYSDPAQMWMALTRLENQIGQSLPDLAPAATAAKDKLFSLLSPTYQKRVTGTVDSDNPPNLTFDEQVEAAEKEADEARRDMKLTFAVTSGSKDATVEKVLAAIDKIADGNIRTPLLNWFYFKRSQALIDEKKFAEARKLAAKVTELDQRAYLYAKIAEQLLKESEDQTQARELLNELSDAAAKAPKTIVTARARLALANLYSRIEANRGVEELAHAVKAINSLEAPDFSVEYVTMKIEGKTFGSYSGFSTPGFNPENVFKDIARIDFDGSLIQAATFTDKSLRAMTTIAVIEPCLEVVPAVKPSKKKPLGVH